MFNKISKDNHDIFSLISGLSRAIRCCQQEAAFCENVTFSQFLILDAVAKNGKLGLTKLHNILSVDKSTTTRLVSPLVKQGLILRERSKRDSRAINLVLTKEGELVRDRVWDCLSDFFDSIQLKIPKKRRKDVFESVKIFIDAMQDACTPTQCMYKNHNGDTSYE